MNPIKEFFKSFTAADAAIWGFSVLAIVLSFVLTGNSDYLQLAASLIGACTLILIAKGNIWGQALSVVFAVFYGVISYYYSYYGEMITYLGMSAPLAIASIFTWLRHPYRGKKTEVTVARPSLREHALLFFVSVLVSVAFFFILRALNNRNLWWSTFSVLTSCLAVLLAMRRSPYHALAYAANDVVLIVLWSLAAAEDRSYIAMAVCFSVFLLNDGYALINWLRMRRRQSRDPLPPSE